MSAVCPSCRRRRARRACPALKRDICTVCCATKRQTEIRCPPDCRYLASAKSHPPAVVQRQRERDGLFILPIVADLPPRLYDLFIFVQHAMHHVAERSETPVDDRTVRESAEALAKTYDTSSKGIIYKHQASSPLAERLSQDVKPLIDDPSAAGGPEARERDLVEVLRRIERAAATAEAALGGGGRAYLDLVARQAPSSARAAGARDADGRKRSGEPLVIVP